MKPKQEDTIYYNGIDDVVFVNAAKRRRVEAESHWEQKYSLKSVREKNNREYLGEYVKDQLIDSRYQDAFIDNRQFTSVRTIVPFLTARVTAAEVTPANGNDLSIQFANDFEEVLQRHATKQKGRAKIRLAIQDLLKGERVGILKWRYDAALDTIVLEHVPPKSIIIGKRSKQFEEPDYLCQTIERSVADLIRMFADKKQKIYQLFGITKGTLSQLEKVHDINEEWMWVDTEKKKELVVGWSYQGFLFGKVKDPNWNENGRNVTETPMIPYVFFNFFNDGSGYIDETSSIEQAQQLQRNYNKRGQTIAENANYGGTGVPMFAKGAITQKDVAKIRFSPIQRVLLDTNDISKAFGVWQSTPLPNYIVEDKYDSRNSIDNIWGTPNIFRGEQSKNNTLGQDVLIRNQAEGRLGDPVDCIDDAMTRFYLLEAQLMYRYFDKKKFYNYIGSSGNFVSLVVSQEAIAENIGLQINVKAGTSLPIDRAQKRATIIELLKMNRVGTLTAYKELGIFDDPEAAYKEFITEMNDPAASLEEVDKQVFNREASEDLQMIIGGELPEEREDIEDQYIEYLNNWLLTDKFKMIQEKKPETASRITGFIDAIIAKAQRKADKMAMQQPETGAIPPEVAAMMGQGQPQPQGAPQQPMPPVPPQGQPPLPPPPGVIQ